MDCDATLPNSTAPRLRVIDGPDRGAAFELTQLPATLGRGNDNAVRLTCRSVSRRHAMVARDERGFIVTDIGSSYGIRVGKHTSSAARLINGTVFNLGDTTLVFEGAGGDEESEEHGRETKDLVRAKPLDQGGVDTAKNLGAPAGRPAQQEQPQPKRHAPSTAPMRAMTADGVAIQQESTGGKVVKIAFILVGVLFALGGLAAIYWASLPVQAP